MNQNPYQTPVSEIVNKPIEPTGFLQAPRLERLGAVIIDGIIAVAITLPIQIGTGQFERAMNNNVSPLENASMSLFGVAIFLVVHGYLLATRSQTVGKWVLSLQIIEHNSENRLPFTKLLLRCFWAVPISIVFTFLPVMIGAVANTIFGLIALVGILLIFQVDHRCLHDYIAGSRVRKLV